MTFQIEKSGKTALVFGASGLVGSYCVANLLQHDAYDKVITFGRRDTGLRHPKITHYVVDFDDVLPWAELVAGDDLFCCLGTTRKKAGSKEAFRKVDFDYVLEIAQFAAVNNVNQFLLVSAVGADPNSMFFYNQVKGELEKAIQKLDFWSTHILQPSVLLGSRSEIRILEKATKIITRVVDRVTNGNLKEYRPIEAHRVANAMVQLAQYLEKGVHFHPSHNLIEMTSEDGLTPV